MSGHRRVRPGRILLRDDLAARGEPGARPDRLLRPPPRLAHRAPRPRARRGAAVAGPRRWPRATCARGCAAARASWGGGARPAARHPGRVGWPSSRRGGGAGRQRRRARRGRPARHRAGRVRVGVVRRRLRRAAATLVVPEVVVGMRGGVAWLTTVGVEPAPAVRRRSGHADDRAAAAPAAPGRRGLRRRRAVGGRVGRCRGRGGRADHGRPARQGGAGPRPRRHHRARRSTCGGCCTGWPSSTARRWVFAVDGLVGATPELLVRREKGLVTSRVLAGTIRRTGDDDARPRARGLARALVEGPRGARVRRALGGRRAGAALLVDERARGAVRAAPVQRHAPGHRRGGRARRRRVVAGARRRRCTRRRRCAARRRRWRTP